jgi:hypothetical protein
MTADEATAMFAFRNALMHSFGFHHEERSGRIIPMVFFQSSQAGPPVIVGDDRWELSLDDLFSCFVFAMGRYRVALGHDEKLRDFFRSTFSKFGAVEFHY